MQLKDIERPYEGTIYSQKKLDYTPTIKIVEGIPKFIEWYLTYS
jgi:hypothetical protein